MIACLCGGALAAAAVLWSHRPAASRLAGLRDDEPPQHRAAASSRWKATVGVGSLALAGGSSLFHVNAVLAGSATLLGPAVWALRRRRSRAAQAAAVATSTRELAFALAGELRAGRSLAEALAAAGEEAGPLAVAVRAAAGAAGHGRLAAPELRRAGAALGSRDLVAVAAAWRVVEQSGGQVASVLEELGTALEGEAELARELDAALAGPRATAVVLAGLPLAGVALGQAVGAHPLQLLIHRPLGWGLSLAAVLLDVAGLTIMGRLSQAALR